jgi:endonuclease/exonuclease/phosphatase family metal-dependent hydrolase
MWLWLCLATALGLFLWARKASSASNQQSSLLHFADPKANTGNEQMGRTLKVATFNVQTGKSLQGKRDIYRSAELVRNADIVAIQEVYAPTWLNVFGLGVSQTQALANHGGFNWLFCATRRRWFREHRGNALLSRYQTKNWQIVMLPDWSGKSYRNYTVAKFDLPEKAVSTELVVINTHLHTKQGRLEQLKIVLEEFEKHPCALLMGDFNTRIDEPVLQEFLEQAKGIDLIQQAGINHDDRIDWIIGKGLGAHSGRRVEKGVSDHPYYEIEIANE